MDFTNLHYATFKDDSKLMLSADEQLTYYISHLKGKIKENWKVLAPTPQIRTIYFELESGNKPELESGSMSDARDEMIGTKKVRKNLNKG